MFGVVEAFTIVGAVAALVSAYKQAGGRFRSWKSKKRNSRFHAQSQALEDSLSHVPQDLQRQCDNCCYRLGSAFTHGDDIAKHALYETIVKFNGTLLECLKKAIAGRHEPDLNNLLRVSQGTGQRANSVLQDLYQRVCQSKLIPRNPSQSHRSRRKSSRSQVNDTNTNHMHPPGDPATLPTFSINPFQPRTSTYAAIPTLSPLSEDSEALTTASTSVSFTSDDVLRANLGQLKDHTREENLTVGSKGHATQHRLYRTSSMHVLRQNRLELSKWRGL